jgi:hypothetical protein
MGRKRLPTAITVRTCEGKPKAYGLVRKLTARGAHIGTSVPLSLGQTLRFSLFDHARSETTERLGTVVWTDLVFDPAACLDSECRVKWMNPTEADERRLLHPGTRREE